MEKRGVEGFGRSLEDRKARKEEWVFLSRGSVEMGKIPLRRTDSSEVQLEREWYPAGGEKGSVQGAPSEEMSGGLPRGRATISR